MMTTAVALKTDSPPSNAVPLLIDTERGSKSVRGSIEAGKITRVHVRKFPELEKIVWDLERGKMAKPSGIIFDTLNTSYTTTLQDVVKENPNGLWANRTALKASYNDFGQANDLFIRLLRVARSFGLPFVLTAHDREREDEALGTLHFPDLPRQLLNDVIANADTVLRLSRSSNIVKIGTQQYPRGTRLIECGPSNSVYAKMRIPDNLPPAPDVIANTSLENWKPAIEKLHKVSGGLFTPDEEGEISPVIIYGAPGLGKTRLAVELLLTEQKDN